MKKLPVNKWWIALCAAALTIYGSDAVIGFLSPILQVLNIFALPA